MKCNIAVIGCGQLGRRHIQGLGLSLSDIQVHVYDVAMTSLDTCKSFVEDISDEIKNLAFSYYDDIQELGAAVDNFDLVIVSSTASERPANLKVLSSAITAKAWLLEKPICQSPEELSDLMSLTKNMNIWVNHFRRCIPWYQDLQSEHFNGQQLDITFQGPDIGIGCNVSHLIDLVNFLTGEVPVSTDVSGLADKWHDSKRQGFKEIDGQLVCQFSNGSTMRVVSDSQYDDLIIKGQFKEFGRSFLIDENKGMVTIDGTSFETGKMPFQSQLTGKVFDQISQQGRSDLTDFTTAADCYRSVIGGLLKHWQSTPEGKQDKTVPLT